jgi:hypothetical protein
MKQTALAIVLAWLPGCGSDSTSGPDAMVDAMVDAPTSDAMLSMLSGIVNGFANGPPYPVIAGATLCVDGRSDLPCAMSDSTGHFRLGVPIGVDYAPRVGLAGYETQLSPRKGGGSGEVYFLGTDTEMAAIANLAGGTYPSSTSGYMTLLIFDLSNQPLGGAQVHISPASGVGPIYFNAQQDPDPTLSATTSAGQANGGLGFWNVAPGMVDVMVTSTTNPNCRFIINGSWPSPTPGAATRIPVEAGARTRATITCSP